MVYPGIDFAKEREDLFKGKRIALITNFTGVDSSLTEDGDVFTEAGWNLVKLFTPEHGLYGAMDGAGVDDSLHPKLHIPMVSLYGEKQKPSAEDLRDVDVLVYDIQDVGLRYYTYIYTLAYCMQAAAECGVPFVVLDRPNPLGDTVGGNVMKPGYESFVGAHRLALRYGLTAGELGYYYIDYLKLKLDYQVVRMEGYRDAMLWPETGQLWNRPSPSIHSFETILCYNGGCFFEATNVSEGRGTAAPFQIYGAPYIELDPFIKELRNRIHNEHLAIRPRAFTPFWSKHAGRVCFGVEFLPLDSRLDFLTDALVTMKTIKDMYPEDFAFTKYADVTGLSSLSGDKTADLYLEGRMSLAEMKEQWEAEADAFRKETEVYRIYR